MFAQINHMAMISPHYAALGKYYEAVFGLKTSTNPRPAQAVTVGDGETRTRENQATGGSRSSDDLLDHYSS